MVKRKKFFSILLLMLLTTPFLALSVSAQTDSLAVWENIADGNLISGWGENTGAEWSPYNDSGIGVYNFTGTVWGYAVNQSIYGHRWMQTFDFTSDSAENGVMVVQAWNNSNLSDDFYAMIYYLAGPATAGPEAYMVYYVAGSPWYYNGTGYETNVSNATNYADQADEYDYQSGGFVRVKALWNWYDTTNDFSARLKVWDAEGGDEPTTWLIDDTFDNYASYGDDYYPGIGADHTFVGSSTSQFRRIFFWNLSYDTYNDVAYIGVPQYDMGTLLDDIEENSGEDYYNYTIAFRDMINDWDLTSYFNYNDISGSGCQNDTIYVFSIMATGILDEWEDWSGEEWDYDAVFPNNVLIMYVYNPTDGTPGDDAELTWDDACRIRFDFEGDGYDADDYTFLVDGTSTLYGYEGWTQVIPDSPVEWYGAGTLVGVEDDGEWGRMFRDYDYPAYVFYLNWDLISGNTDAGEFVNISISLYDNESSNFSVWQDWNETDEGTFKTGSDNETWQEVNVTTLWGLMRIEGAALDFDDPSDPTSPSVQTNFITTTVVPILVAVIVMFTISGMLLGGGITKETIIAGMMAAIIGVIVISVIAGL